MQRLNAMLSIAPILNLSQCAKSKLNTAFKRKSIICLALFLSATLVFITDTADANAALPTPTPTHKSHPLRSHNNPSSNNLHPNQNPEQSQQQTIPHVTLTAQLTHHNTLEGTARWHWVNNGDTPIKQIQFILAPNMERIKNPNLSSIVQAQGFFNGWQASEINIIAVKKPHSYLSHEHTKKTSSSEDQLNWRYIDGPASIQTYSLAHNYLEIDLAEPLLPGQKTIVTITFITQLPNKEIEGGHFNGETTYRFGWFPQPRYWEYKKNDKGSHGSHKNHNRHGVWSEGFVLTRFTHRTELTVPHAKHIIIGADTLSRHFNTATAESNTPVRSVPFVVSNHLDAEEVWIDGIKVVLYTYDDKRIIAAKEKRERTEKIKQLKRILPYYNLHYGRYKLKTLHLIESPNSGVSLTADGLILLSDLFYIHNNTWLAGDIYGPIGEQVLAHEVAHLWWGIGQGVDFDKTNWLSEGMAELLSHRYFESVHGDNAADMFAPNWLVQWFLANLAGVTLPEHSLTHILQPAYEDHLRFNTDEAIEQPTSTVEHGEESAYRFYQKGYLAARGLAALLGTEGLDRTLRYLHEAPSNELITLETLASAAQKVTGIDPTRYLTRYVRSEYHSDISIENVVWTPTNMGADKSSGIVKIKLSLYGDDLVPVTVQITTEQGRIIEQQWDPKKEHEILSVELKSAPMQIIIDPKHFAPDTNRRNNYWPKNIDWSWLEPHANGDAYSLGFNPAPLHRDYIIGLTIAGKEGTKSRWSIGTGINELSIDNRSDVNTDKNTYQNKPKPILKSFNSKTTLRFRNLLSRSNSIGVKGVFSKRQYINGYSPNGIKQKMNGEINYTIAFFEQTDLGSTANFELPRINLSILAGTENHEQFPDSSSNLTSTWNYIGLGLTRDDVINNGIYYGCQLDLGVAPQNKTDIIKRGQCNVISLSYLTGLGQLIGISEAFALSHFDPNKQLSLTPPTLLATPVITQNTTANKLYGAAATMGWSLTTPLIKNARINNILTLWTFIFNDLSWRNHIAGMVGSNWSEIVSWQESDGKDKVAVDYQGEWGTGLVVGLSLFDATPLEFEIGIGGRIGPGINPKRLYGFIQAGLGF